MLFLNVAFVVFSVDILNVSGRVFQNAKKHYEKRETTT